MAGRFSSRLQSTATIGFIKLLLTIFNIVFLSSGVALLCIGIWTHIELYKYMQINTVYYDSLPYILIGIGFGVVVVGTLGCICTIKGHGKLLYIFAVFLIIVFIIQIGVAVTAFVFRTKIQEGFKDGMKKAMKEYNEDMEIEHIVDGIQIKLKCCGMESYKDWEDEVPRSCCAHKKCNPLISDMINQEGCVNKLTNFINSNLGIIGGVVVGFAFIQLLGALLSCCLAKYIHKAKYEQVE